jgi:hypothetical protein
MATDLVIPNAEERCIIKFLAKKKNEISRNSS